jgi:hypothetical protein
MYCLFYGWHPASTVVIDLHTQPCPSVYPNIFFNLLDRIAYRYMGENLDNYNQCCGSGMFIPDPDFLPIPVYPKTATKERGGGRELVVIPFYVATNFTILKIILVLKC